MINDPSGVRVLLEPLQVVDEGSAHDGIPSDADAGGLPETHARQLVHHLIGEGAAPGDDPHVAGLVDVAGHDAYLGLPGGDDSGQLGPISTVRLSSRAAATFTMSRAGMPS